MTAPATVPPAAARRRCGRFAFLLLLLANLVLCRGPILRGAGALLVAEDPDEGVSADVLFDPGLDCEQLATRYRAAPRPLLLLRWAPDRLVQTGLVPPGPQRVRTALQRLGVAADALQELPGDAHDYWDGARVLRCWLTANPSARVAVLCERFESRRLRSVLDRVLGSEASRAAVVALADARGDEASWWQSKAGCSMWVTGVLRLGFRWIQGEGIKPKLTWDPTTCERLL
jgi:hypothetical protein